VEFSENHFSCMAFDRGPMKVGEIGVRNRHRVFDPIRDLAESGSENDPDFGLEIPRPAFHRSHRFQDVFVNLLHKVSMTSFGTAFRCGPIVIADWKRFSQISRSAPFGRWAVTIESLGATF